MNKLLLSAIFATAVFSSPAMAKVEPDIIRTTYGDFDAQGLLLSANETALKAMNFKKVEKKANKGDKDAQYHLAKMYELGIHTQKDKTKALEWYKKSAENGNVNAMNNYATMLLDNAKVDEALIWFKKASELNQPHAKMNLAYYYLNQENKADIQKGVDLLLELGENGFAPAYFVLSQVAEILPKDISEKLYQNENDFFNHIKKSAEMGYSPAQAYLGGFSGLFFWIVQDDDKIQQLTKHTQNTIDAYGWAKRACNNGNKDGCESLAIYDEYKDSERMQFLKGSCDTETDLESKQQICQTYQFYQDLNQAIETIDKRYQ
ncbi:MAG: tetratricopeptide repeat protein [Moraxella equi]|nr:tetratricopeptide repeat protein [Moraxella equi]